MIHCVPFHNVIKWKDVPVLQTQYSCCKTANSQCEICRIPGQWHTVTQVFLPTYWSMWSMLFFFCSSIAIIRPDHPSPYIPLQFDPNLVLLSVFLLADRMSGRAGWPFPLKDVAGTGTVCNVVSQPGRNAALPRHLLQTLYRFSQSDGGGVLGRMNCFC